MDNSELSFGQRKDSQGWVQPWFTHDCLDEIEKWDLSNKIIWMWGAGKGDAWLAKKCKELYVVERDQEWLIKAAEVCQVHGVNNVKYFHRPCEEGSGFQDMYCGVLDGVKPDIFIADDVYRYECILKAIEMKPCVLIVDNWMQDFVFICPDAEIALDQYRSQVFPQKNHTNFEKRRWKTAIFYIE